MTQEAAPFFRDVADHVIRVSESIETLDSLLSTAFDAHLARISVQQNEDMRKISAWVAIAAVGTLVAGVYGMNFRLHPGAELALRLLLRARPDAGLQRRALPVLQEVRLAVSRRSGRRLITPVPSSDQQDERRAPRGRARTGAIELPATNLSSQAIEA